MRVLGIITARGGSKGVPYKNIKLLGGKPLLQYTWEAAKQAELLTDIVLSTEDEKIAEVGDRLGIEIPFLRPAELALDNTPTLPVLVHLVTELAKMGREYDAICLLQPTNPFRKSTYIDGCIKLMFDGDYDATFTMLPVPHEYNPHWAFFQSSDGNLTITTGEKEIIPRRQELPIAYHREGSVYVTKTSVLLEKQSLYGEKIGGYEIDNPVLINIDTMSDWEKAEDYLKNLR
ncbi:MAG: acylneuraminate cytidylyltransferase family protein [Bacteroidota bacterium]|nr:acylneuraminate cytidylyltransferase family protein [Bacteroidota bacterium]